MRGRPRPGCPRYRPRHGPRAPRPPVEPLVDAVTVAEPLRQVAPTGAGAGASEPGIDECAAVVAGRPRRVRATGQEGFDPLPRLILQFVPPHQMPSKNDHWAGLYHPPFASLDKLNSTDADSITVLRSVPAPPAAHRVTARGLSPGPRHTPPAGERSRRPTESGRPRRSRSPGPAARPPPARPSAGGARRAPPRAAHRGEAPRPPSTTRTGRAPPAVRHPGTTSAASGPVRRCPREAVSILRRPARTGDDRGRPRRRAGGEGGLVAMGSAAVAGRHPADRHRAGGRRRYRRRPARRCRPGRGAAGDIRPGHDRVQGRPGVAGRDVPGVDATARGGIAGGRRRCVARRRGRRRAWG